MLLLLLLLPLLLFVWGGGGRCFCCFCCLWLLFLLFFVFIVVVCVCVCVSLCVCFCVLYIYFVVVQILGPCQELGRRPRTPVRGQSHFTVEERRASFAGAWDGPPPDVMALCGMFKVTHGKGGNRHRESCFGLLHFLFFFSSE